MFNKEEARARSENRRSEKLARYLSDIANALQVPPKHADVMAEIYAMIGRSVTQTRRVQELEAELAKAEQRGHVLNTPRGMEAYDSKGVLRVSMGALHVKAEDFISSKSSLSTAQTATDTALQADIEYLKGRVNELENAHRFSFGAGKGTSNGMAVFQETVNRGIEQALRSAVSPGGILYGKLK